MGRHHTEARWRCKWRPGNKLTRGTDNKKRQRTKFGVGFGAVSSLKFPTDRQFRPRLDSKCKREPALAEWTFESQCEGWCRSFDSAGVAPWRGSRDDAAGSIDRPVACLPGMHGSVFGRSEPGESAESAGSTSESGHARGRRDGTQPGWSELSGF